jgi:(2R)-sulfolactate sulfo-lyase subunit beta
VTIGKTSEQRSVAFPSGQGNIIGHPIEPVIKLTVNPTSNAPGCLRREYALPESGDLLMQVVERTINGRLTCAEALGHREFVITKLYPSA